MRSSLIEITIGKRVMEYETGRIGTVKDIKIVPNGMYKPELIAILFVEMDGPRGKSVFSATSEKFRPCDEETYDELYPSVHANRIAESLREPIEYKPSHG